MKAPLFVKIDRYREITDTIKTVKERLSEAHSALEKLQDLKHQEDRQLAQWQSEIEELGSKVDSITQELGSQQ